MGIDWSEAAGMVSLRGLSSWIVSRLKYDDATGALRHSESVPTAVGAGEESSSLMIAN